MTSVPNATILTPAQIAYYAQTAGFDGDDLSIAVAIALAESSGNTNVYNPETAAGTPPGQGSYGLWQIYLHAHPEYSADNLYDPQTNANDAYELYSNAGGFSPWGTFHSGAYRNYLVPGASSAPVIPGLTPGEIAAGGYSMAQAPTSSSDLFLIAALGLLGLFVVGILGD
jgi:hypothetical protein